MAFTVMLRPAAAASRLTTAEPRRDRLDHGLHCEPAVLVEFRREPDLGVHHPVGGEVDDGFARHPLDVVRGLHHRQRVLEGGQVLQEVSGLCSPGEPRLQCVGFGFGQCPPDRVGQLHDRRHPQPAVEVIVQ